MHTLMITGVVSDIKEIPTKSGVTMTSLRIKAESWAGSGNENGNLYISMQYPFSVSTYKPVTCKEGDIVTVTGLYEGREYKDKLMWDLKCNHPIGTETSQAKAPTHYAPQPKPKAPPAQEDDDMPF